MTTQFFPQKVLHLHKELEKKKPNLVGDYMVTIKAEGWYLLIHYIKNLGWQTPLSYNSTSKTFREVPSLVWTSSLLQELPTPQWNCTLIVEGIVPDLPFEKTNGLLNRKNEPCLGVQFCIHDLVVPSLPVLTSIERWKLLQSLDVSNCGKLFRKLELIQVSSFNQLLWENLAAKYIAQGEEGIVFKKADAAYAFGKRNATLLKLKMECEKDLQCLRLELTQGKKDNTGYTLVSKGLNNVEVRTVVNSHEEQRKLIKLTESNSLDTCVVKVKAMRELEDGNLKEPVYVGIRNDKDAKDID
jgi:ATP-dependent DNA ligase